MTWHPGPAVRKSGTAMDTTLSTRLFLFACLIHALLLLGATTAALVGETVFIVILLFAGGFSDRTKYNNVGSKRNGAGKREPGHAVASIRKVSSPPAGN